MNKKKLCNIIGVCTERKEVDGGSLSVSDEIINSFLKNLGINANDESVLKKQLRIFENTKWIEGLSPFLSFFASEANKSFILRLPESITKTDFSYFLTDEAGNRNKTLVDISDDKIIEKAEIEGVSYFAYSINFDKNLAVGYYRLSLDIKEKNYTSMVLVAPDKCYQNTELIEGESKHFGVNVPIYALNSDRNFGIGDYTDLKNFAKILAENGGKILALSPLNMPFYKGSLEFSPYKVMDRRIFNYFYLDVEQIPDYFSENIKYKVSRDSFKFRLETFRHADKINYKEICLLKLGILKDMYNNFAKNELDVESGITKRGEEFLSYIRGKGNAFKNLCVFNYLIDRFEDSNWQRWPNSFKNPHSVALWDFEDENKTFWQFYAYLYMYAEKQINEVKSLCHELGLVFMMDMPVGASLNSAETWLNSDYYINGVELGDNTKTKGESLEIVAVNPINVKKLGYNHFIKALQQNFSMFDVVRIDYGSYMFKSFLLYDADDEKKSGTCIKYDEKDILAILSIESNRNKCMVSFEFDEKSGLSDYGVVNYHIYAKEKDDEGNFKTLSNLKDKKTKSFMVSSDYNNPTMQGFWTGYDIKLYEELRIYKDFLKIRDDFEYRSFERKYLLQNMARAKSFINPDSFNDFKKNITGDNVPKLLNLELANYFSKFFEDKIYLMRLEDMVEQKEITKLKWTKTEYNNWQNRIKLKIEDMANAENFIKFFKILKGE